MLPLVLLSQSHQVRTSLPRRRVDGRVRKIEEGRVHSLKAEEKRGDSLENVRAMPCPPGCPCASYFSSNRTQVSSVLVSIVLSAVKMTDRVAFSPRARSSSSGQEPRGLIRQRWMMVLSRRKEGLEPDWCCWEESERGPPTLSSGGKWDNERERERDVERWMMVQVVIIPTS